MARIKDDNNGGVIASGVDSVELMTSIDWGKLFSTVTDEEITICTFGMPNVDYFDKHIGQMKNLTVIIGLTKWIDRGALTNRIMKINPNCRLLLRENTHAKIVLIAPNHVYLSSQNLRPADWYQNTVHIQDDNVYKFYKEKVDLYIADEKNTGNFDHSLDMSRMYLDEHYKAIKGLYAPVKPANSKTISTTCNLARTVNWAQKLSGLNNDKKRDNPRNIIITTYDIPDEHYAIQILDLVVNQHNNRVELIVNSEFGNQAESLYKAINNVNFTYSLRPDVHAKMVLVDDNIVWLSSQNFGKSSWFENTIKLEGKKAYKYYHDRLKEWLDSPVELKTIDDLMKDITS